MGTSHIRTLPGLNNMVLVIDEQTTGRAIREQLVRGMDDRVAVQGLQRPVDAAVCATWHVGDLVLDDYPMPDSYGLEFARRLRALPGREHVPVVMVTAHDDRKIRHAALDAGIMKPSCNSSTRATRANQRFGIQRASARTSPECLRTAPWPASLR